MDVKWMPLWKAILVLGSRTGEMSSPSAPDRATLLKEWARNRLVFFFFLETLSQYVVAEPCMEILAITRLDPTRFLFLPATIPSKRYPRWHRVSLHHHKWYETVLNLQSSTGSTSPPTRRSGPKSTPALRPWLESAAPMNPVPRLSGVAQTCCVITHKLTMSSRESSIANTLIVIGGEWTALLEKTSCEIIKGLLMVRWYRWYNRVWMVEHATYSILDFL